MLFFFSGNNCLRWPDHQSCLLTVFMSDECVSDSIHVDVSHYFTPDVVTVGGRERELEQVVIAFNCM